MIQTASKAAFRRSLQVVASVPKPSFAFIVAPPPVAIVEYSRTFASSGSHDDFAPIKKEVVDADEAMKLIDNHVKNNPVMVYMKGNPSMPMCGFSAKVVQILQKEGIDFSSVNVLDYPEIREGVKKYSEWPTVPQVYILGEFIGGCDIVTAMHESGELTEVLGKVPK